MRTLVVGCNHRSATVAQRERIAFSESQVPRALEQLKHQFPAAEAVLISTCNRTELYVARPLQDRPRIDDLMQFIAHARNVNLAEFASSFYCFEDLQAVRHLFRMASSLDSMVLGESQILGQARTALEIARSAGTAGKTLESLFQQAFATAKTIHTTTGIATGRLSVGSTAVDLARQIFSGFDDKTVLMVGAGEMGKLTLTHLLSTRPKRLCLANRTDARAVELAERLARQHGVAAEPVPWSRWLDQLAEADVVITCTGASEPILTAGEFAPIPERRKYRPLLIIDIAVPRDVDPAAVAGHDSVFLYNIDDLQVVTEATLAQREQAITRCHEIIESAVVEVAQQRSPQQIGPLIEALRRRFSDVGQRELERMLPKLDAASPHDRELIEQMLHRVTQKLLHDPLQLLSTSPADGATQVYADTLRALFDLDIEEK